MKRIMDSRRAGLATLVVLIAATGLYVATSQGSAGASTPPVFRGAADGVTVKGNLSSTKIVQGDRANVYLGVSIDTDESKNSLDGRQPADVLVILDHSGSMGDDRKLPYAKAAIQDLLSRLTPDDRFALVAFDSGTDLLSDFVHITASERERLSRIVAGINPGSGTNMGEGLLLGKRLLQGSGSNKSRRVILLSDGEANEGIVGQGELDTIASSLKELRAVLSSIGMGLGFNETLMASLADRGGGNFSYLEHLDLLAGILSKDLNDARRIFASDSTIEIRPGAGFSIVDAGGYPIDHDSGGLVRIGTGQLLTGSTKRFFITLAPDTAATGDLAVGNLALVYTNGDVKNRVGIPGETLKLTVVSPEFRTDAIASIDKDIYRDAWLANNAGIMQRSLNAAVKSGDRTAAAAAISTYRQELRQAAEASQIDLLDAGVDTKLKKMESKVADAFAGPAPSQAMKQNRLSKEAMSESLSLQRPTTK